MAVPNFFLTILPKKTGTNLESFLTIFLKKTGKKLEIWQKNFMADLA